MKFPHLRKPRSDSPIEKLPVDQKNTLLRWLFKDNLTYVQASLRLQSEFRVKASASAICRFYARTMERRALERAVQVHISDYAPGLQDTINPPRRAPRTGGRKPQGEQGGGLHPVQRVAG